MFIAVTRFSLYLPKSSAWIASREVNNEKTLENYKEKLFNEERLNFRINFLSKITIPNLKKSTKNVNFLQIIEYSKILPEKFKLILKDLESKNDFIKLNEYDENGMSNKTTQDITISHFNLDDFNKDSFLGQFVLDDDDCLSLDFFDKSKKYINKSFYGFAISHGLGVYGLFDQNNKIEHICESYYPKVNIGLIRVGVFRSEQKKIVFARLGTHTKSDRFLPTVIDSREISYWWSKHKSQDTSSLEMYSKDVVKIISSERTNEDIISEKFGKNFIKDLKSLGNKN